MSVLLHIAVAVVAVLVSMIQPPKPKPPTVFELVSAPPPVQAVAPDDAAVEFNVPEVQPLPPPPKPKPKPPPEPIPERPKPRPAPVQKPKPKPKPPEPRPEPPPQKLSYEEYLKKFGPPKTRPPRQSKPKPVAVPRITTEFSATIRENLVNLSQLGQLTDQEQSAWDRYLARLREALRRTWSKPPGLAHTTAAVVEFDVAANGRISNPAITKSSGIAEFDRSVLAAVNALGNAGAPPDGRPQRLRFTFRMTD